LIIGLPIFLSVIGLQKAPLWLLQILAIYAPLFLLERISRCKQIVATVPNIVWVVLGGITVVALRLTIFAGHPFVTVATGTHTPPAAVGLVYAFSVLLGSLDKYFVDSYVSATAEQEVTQNVLNARLKATEVARQATRDDLARILHGPIQGRLASVRLQLNMLDEMAQSQIGTSSQTNAMEIADIIDDIAHDVQTLGELQQPESKLSTKEQIALLQRNWMGFLTVNYTCSPKADAVLASNPILDKKVATACMEVTTNASRHGDASELVISVELVDDESILRLIAQDNGCGTRGPVTPGMGLSEIDANGGSWSFEPCTTGARLRVDFPVNLLRE
jgi:signal transduction histidine kinase